MVKRFFYIWLLLITSSFLVISPVADPSAARKKRKQTQAPQHLVPFSFEKRPLVDIIDFLKNEKKIEVIFPVLAADAETLRKQTITYQPQGATAIPLNQAWSLLTTFLELSGFSIVPKEPGVFAIIRTGRPDEPGVSRESLPLYVGTPPDELPKSAQRIRYIYYLRNLKTPGTDDRETNPLTKIFRDMLSPGAPVIPEPKSNGFVIIDKADTIASVMKIISELDATGFKETVDVIPIHNVPARDIVRVFDSLKKAAGEIDRGGPFIRGDAQTDVSYFAADTKIVADDRTNNLILMGRETAVERISDFIHEHMDIPQESGQSILHTYDLQYLDAQTFAGVLQNIVSSPLQGAQATQGILAGAERTFQGVVVMAEEVKTVEARTTTEEVTVEERGGFTPAGVEGKIFTGGNRLIIAAVQDDWTRIRDLIESLDKPQPQVILEVLIVDFTARRDKLIASTLRNLTNGPFQPSEGVQFLASHISPPRNVLANPPTRLAEDLLTLITSGDTSGPTPVTSLLQQGSLVISYNDPTTPGIFGLLQLLDAQVDSKIISHPYLVTTNNQKATITSQVLKRARGDAIPGAAGVTTVEIVDVPATIQVQMIPRLSSLERLSLQVAVDINEFIGGSLDRITRRVNTNANLGSGNVLVIGGLTRVENNDVKTETPFLSKIPLIGNLFKRTSKRTTKTNLAVFIAPTIVQPKLRGGLDLYTADKIRKTRRDVDDTAIFGDTQDPITRIYFMSGPKSDQIISNFLAHVENAPDAALLKTTREKRREQLRPKRRIIVPQGPAEKPKPSVVGEVPA